MFVTNKVIIYWCILYKKGANFCAQIYRYNKAESLKQQVILKTCYLAL